MVNVPMNSTTPIDNGTINGLNQIRVQQPVSAQNVRNINNGCPPRPIRSMHPAQVQGCGVTPAPVRQQTAPAQSSIPSPTQSSIPSPAQTNPVYNQTTSYQQITPAYGQPAQAAVTSPTASAVTDHPVPQLIHKTMKGQKVLLENGAPLSGLKACLGWSVKNAACDVDVSAFLLNASGKVIGDEWFVFYGQETSPDQSTRFAMENNVDLESITINLSRLNPQVSQIVFVLTINEALEKQLNFSMIKDAYVRILDTASGNEIVSFLMDEYYANVTSMMIGSVYKHNGQWKFNAMGSGVARDLAGLCEYYGVEVQ